MNEAVITVAVILFPGILATLMVENFLNYSPKWGSFKFSVYSFVLGVMTYIALQLIIMIIGIFPSKITILPQLTGTLDIWTFAGNREGVINLYELFAAIIISPFFGIIVARLTNDKKWIGLNKLAGSKKYGKENLFSHFLAAEGLDHVYIRDYEQDIMYEGSVASFSENDDIQEIVLENVRVFRNHDSELLESLPSIYISRPVGKFLIEDAPEEIKEQSDDTKDKTAS